MAPKQRKFKERVVYLTGIKARRRRKLAQELIGDSYCFRIPNEDKTANDAAVKKELQKLRDQLAKEKQMRKKAKERTHGRGTVKRARRSSPAPLQNAQPPTDQSQCENSRGTDLSERTEGDHR